MAYTPVNRVAHMTLIFSWAGQEFTNSLDFHADRDLTGSILDDIATNAEGAFSGGLDGAFYSSITLTAIRVTDLSAFDAESILHPVDPAIAGTASGTPLTVNDALVITKRTLKRGRAFRGRIYSAGRVTADLDDIRTFDAALVSAVAGLWTTFVATILSGVTSAILEHVLVTRQIDGSTLLTPEVNQIVALQGQQKIGSQRRRLRT